MSAWWKRTPTTDAEERWTPAVWPGDAATVERWLRLQLCSADDEVQITGLDDIRTTVELDGTDISHLLIDATHVALAVRPGAGPAPAPASDEAERDILSREPGMLRFARLAAGPVVVQGHEIHLDATLQNLPVDWVQYATPLTPERPETVFGIDESRRPSHPSGTFSARMRSDEIGPLIAAMARPLLASAKVRLRRLEVTLAESRNQTITLRALASVRWKIFGAAVRATAVVRITPDAVVTVKRLRVRSRNPAIAIGLRMVRDELRAVEGQSHDLNAELGPGSSVRIRDVRVSVGYDTEISARIS